MRKLFTFFILIMMGSTQLLAEGFTLSSKDLQGQLSKSQVFNGFGCQGENISPQLSWENIPKGTKSFAITVYDKDAPTGSGWWHWVVFNLEANTTQLAQNAGNKKMNLLPKGAIQSVTDFGGNGFGGACPPVGDKAHQYIFTVHALDIEKLDLKENTSPALVGYMLNIHTIQKASLVSYYKR